MTVNDEKVEEAKFNSIETVLHSGIFRELIACKKRFLIRVILFFVCFYFALPLGIILFPKIMAIQVFHHFTVAWVFAFLQFIMIWGLGGLYYFKAKQFDRLVEKLAPWGQGK